MELAAAADALFDALEENKGVDVECVEECLGECLAALGRMMWFSSCRYSL